MEVTTAQSCVSGDGRENGNMWLPYVPNSKEALGHAFTA